MTAQPLVSVIVAARDIASLVPFALDSLRAQTLTQWRAVLVDDGSLDTTADVFAHYCERDPRFILVRHERSRGLGAARNSALDMVDTEFVTFLDGDDVMRPHALETMVGSLQASASDIAVCGYVRLRLESGRWQTGEMQPWVRSSISPARAGLALAEHPEVVNNIVAWSKVSRTELWRDLRFPEGVRYEDQFIAQQLYTSASAIDLIDDALIEWRIRADGTSITQHEAEQEVLADCLTQMAAGLAHLERSSPAGFLSRTTQILRMDVPRLAQAATTERTRHMLAEFVGTLHPAPADLTLRVQSPSNPNDPRAPRVSEVYDIVRSWN